MIYFLTAIGLKPGGSSTVHIYTQTLHRTTQSTQFIEQHNSLIGKSADRAPSLRVIPWHLPYNWGKSTEAMRQGLTGTQREAHELIFGPLPAAKIRLPSFKRIQSRVVTGPFTGHNTLRSHLYIMGLMDSPLCRRCGAEELTAAHVLCECEALATLKYIYLGTFIHEQWRCYL
jgi:hypothetical protein